MKGARCALFTAVWNLLAGAVALVGQNSPVPELPSGELEALRAVLDAELESTSHDRVEVGRALRVRWDSRRERQELLGAVRARLSDVTAAMVESFEHRNASRFRLWPEAQRRLGQRSVAKAFLLANPTEVHVQFARVGWETPGELGLVYLELRPREAAEATRGIFRVVSRERDGWRVHEGRASFERKGF